MNFGVPCIKNLSVGYDRQTLCITHRSTTKGLVIHSDPLRDKCAGDHKLWIEFCPVVQISKTGHWIRVLLAECG